MSVLHGASNTVDHLFFYCNNVTKRIWSDFSTVAHIQKDFSTAALLLIFIRNLVYLRGVKMTSSL
jgi:hypothetical protein